MMKKLIAVLLAGLMLVSLAACSNKEDKEDDRDKYKEEEVVEAAPTTKVCPFCKTEINIEATRCPSCTSEVE